MKVIFLLIGFGILLAGGFLAAFFWAVRSGQFDDTFSPSVRILQEDQPRDESSPTEEPANEKPASENSETGPDTSSNNSA